MRIEDEKRLRAVWDELQNDEIAYRQSMLALRDEIEKMLKPGRALREVDMEAIKHGIQLVGEEQAIRGEVRINMVDEIISDLKVRKANFRVIYPDFSRRNSGRKMPNNPR